MLITLIHVLSRKCSDIRSSYVGFLNELVECILISNTQLGLLVSRTDIVSLEVGGAYKLTGHGPSIDPITIRLLP